MLNLVSIGGNALENSKTLKSVLDAIYLLSKKGGVVVTHGNGPQVGELASTENLSLGLLTAQTEAQIGVMLEEEILKHFKSKGGVHTRVETVLTRVLVDSKDPAFRNPTKPIGRFYTARQAKELAGNFTIKKLIHGYRRVVASPVPLKILNLDTIKSLLGEGYIVVACGGGGIPITYKGSWYDFPDAVIDKDHTASLLARELGADLMVTLTTVDGAYLNFGKKNAKLIGKISVAKISEYEKAGYFEQGSMGPKVRASIDFARKTGKRAAIGNLAKAKMAVSLKNCTVIER